jgi:hypothetical protein
VISNISPSAYLHPKKETMEMINENDLIRNARTEYSERKKVSPKTRSDFYRKAIFLGIGSGALMSFFLATSGFYITGDSAAVGFAKYLVLAAALGVLLSQVKRRTPGGKTFKNGIGVGMLLSLVSAITTAVLTIIVNSIIDVSTIQPYFQQGSGAEISSIVLAGVTFFEGIVAGMILTFIWLQILKDRRSGAEI